MSPIPIGLICAKTPESNISRLGPFKGSVKKKDGKWQIIVSDSGDQGLFIFLCRRRLVDVFPLQY